MLRKNDVILLSVVSVSIMGGVVRPALGRPFQPLLEYMLMFMLFLSFLGIRIGDIRSVIAHAWKRIAFITILKILLVPVAVFLVVSWIFPEFALGMLLLAGISTGVVAPFMSGLISANTALVLAVVVLTSLITPFSLPVLVQFLAGKDLSVPMLGMIRSLVMIIFIPMFLSEIFHRLAPAAVAGLRKTGFPVSLVMFGLINLGVFSKYAPFFYQQPDIVVKSLIAAVLLSGVFIVIGIMAMKYAALEDQLAAAICLGNMNNVTVIVFAGKFFGVMEPTLAAMYMFPFFGLIIPLRIYQQRRSVPRT
jgi:bile acid:Na+ symporter, BASS family